MAGTMQELQDALTAQTAKIDELVATLADLVSDVNDAFDTLKAQILAGSDTGPALQVLSDSFAKLDAAIASMKNADTVAEEVTGIPTPVNPAP